MNPTNDKIDLASWAVEHAKKAGANGVTVAISSSRSVEVTYRDHKIDKLAEAGQNSLNISIYVDGRFSQHSTSDMRKETLEKFIKQAIVATRYLSPDEFRVLPDPKYYPKSFQDLKTLDAQISKLEPEQRIKLAAQLSDQAKSANEKIISAEGYYSDNQESTVRVHSNGFVGTEENSNYDLSCSVTAKDKEARPEGSYGASTLFIKDLPKPETVAQLAVEKTLSRIGQTKIASGKYLTLLENRVASQFLSVVLQALRASAIQQKSSYLENMLGKKIASEKLTIIDNPLLPSQFGSRNFDNEGLAARSMPIIENGVLRNFYVNTYYGNKLKMEPTTGYQSNLVWQLGQRPAAEMLKGMDKGIYITSFLGGNANSTTGDFSYGISGFYVEKGAIVKPINEMNITGNALEVWNQLVEVGNDPYPYSSNLRPSLLFDQLNFSGL